METHCGCKPTKTNQTLNNGMPKQSLSSTAPHSMHSFLLLPHYCISVLASRGAVSEIKAIWPTVQMKWDEYGSMIPETSLCYTMWERARRNRLKASADCGLPGIDSHWRISQELWIMFICTKVMLVFDCEEKALCACERLWLLNVPSFSYNKTETERFFIKMEISNAYFMVENIWIFSQTKCESHSKL